MVIISLNKFIDEVIRGTGATHYTGFYASKEDDRRPNFRYAIDGNYKKQRPEEPDWIIKWRPVIHEEMNTKWGFQPVDRIEADDACSIMVNSCKDDYDELIVATADKDLLQIPNTTYYNYTKHESQEVDEFSAIKALATQLLVGDSADNIKGLYKVGPVKAKNLLSPCTTIEGLTWTVLRTYIEQEEVFKAKAIKTITSSVKKDINNSEWAKGKSDKQIQREVRIRSKNLIKQEVDKLMPGGWKNYFHTQYSLLKLLEKDDDFNIPDVREYENIEEVIKKKDDTFLYI